MRPSWWGSRRIRISGGVDVPGSVNRYDGGVFAGLKNTGASLRTGAIERSSTELAIPECSGRIGIELGDKCVGAVNFVDQILSSDHQETAGCNRNGCDSRPGHAV